jgi:Mn2+/Fe2+ NRAMP family transporter
LLTGGFVWLQRLLIGLVLAMSAVFLAAAVFLLPRWTALPLSHFQPDLPQGGWWTAVALLGTTVVPYNLFLHARSVQERWDGERDVTVSLRESRWDTGWAIVLGGVVTAAILLTAVVAFHVPGVRLEELSQVVAQLEPVAGAQGCYLFAAGLFGAGLTSAITAPLAAAWVAAGCLGWNSGWTDWRFRGVGVGVVWIGAAAAILGGGSPRAVILFAQGANGLLLPVIGIFLLVTMNRHSLLGSHRNGFWANFLGVGVLVIALILGWRPWAQWF